MDFFQHYWLRHQTPKRATKIMESSAAATTVVDIYNSSNQVLFEPGILDTVGNALLNIMPNLSAAPFLTNSVENSNYFFNEASSVNSSGTNNESLVENVNILRHEPAIIGIICLFYGFVFIFGIVGNLLTIMVVVRLPRMRNVTNYFIVSLAVADLLVLALCLPGTLMSNIFIRKYPVYLHTRIIHILAYWRRGFCVFN